MKVTLRKVVFDKCKSNSKIDEQLNIKERDNLKKTIKKKEW